MRKVLTAILGIVLMSAICVGCNYFSRAWGGTVKIHLDQNVRVINASWKGTDLWVLTKNDTTKPAEYHYKEYSTFGVMQGEVILYEK